MAQKIGYLVLSYLVAGIPFGLIFSLKLKGVDPRKVGSGNIGATNVFRAAGGTVALLTAIFDISKGFFPTLFAIKLFSFHFGLLTGLVTVAGHSFSPYLKLRGGKGVATATGAFLALFPWALITGAIVWCLIFLITRIVSVSSLSGSFAVFLTVVFKTRDIYADIVVGLLFIVIVLRHSSNIGRLIKGQEPRMSFRKR